MTDVEDLDHSPTHLGILRAEEECVETVLSQTYPNDGRLYCNATFDGWGCWNHTLAGTTASAPCPAFIEGFDSRLLASKICRVDGQWWRNPLTLNEWSNYTSCIDVAGLQQDRLVITVFIAGYSISMTAMIISLAIFFYFKQLNCDRITLHKNLFISYIMNGIAWILSYTLVAADPGVMKDNPIWCKVLHFWTSYFTVCNFFWMFNEGFYLHTIIVVAFTSGKKLLGACYIVGWVLPVFIVLLYTLVRAFAEGRAEDMSCWVNDSKWHWINAGPICASLILNVVFLCNIIRVLVTKMRAVNSPDTNQTRKAVRATIILIPLLGLQYLIIPFRPEKETPPEKIYLILAACVVSFQGLFVAIIFCFCNGEVISLVKRKWGQHQLMRGHSGNSHGRPGATYLTQLSTQAGEFTPTVDKETKKESICAKFLRRTSPRKKSAASEDSNKNSDKLYRFGSHKHNDDKTCCSAV